MKYNNIFRLSLFVILINGIFGHVYHAGICPTVPGQPKFTMDKFLGKWYAIQKSSTSSSCLTYNFIAEGTQYKITQTSQHLLLGMTPMEHEYSYSGILTVPYGDNPSVMTVKFPFNVAGSSNFTVFTTDYTSFAGIFSCQKLGFAHRRSATLLSRTRQLDTGTIELMRDILRDNFVNPFDLSILNQNDCPMINKENKSLIINIDENTLTAKSVANVFRMAGEKIGNGVEYAIEAGKKLYHQISDNDENSNINTQKSGKSLVKPEDAEWMIL